ncbi:hypothetical protein KM043_015676 [Ampulex compressa]|nr:hypothetical protein KM043_015676 [Ampulex compressa]
MPAYKSLPESLNPVADSIRAILELANASKPHNLPLNILIRCADHLVNIIINQRTDSIVKRFAVAQAHAILVDSVTQKSCQVLERYVREKILLEKLHSGAFSEQNLELSAVCLQLLGFIVHCQSNFSVQCNTWLAINIGDLTKLLLATRKSLLASKNIMQFLLEILTENTEEGTIRLAKIAEGTEEKTIFDLYETLHIIHAKLDATGKDVGCQCLEGLLKFCNKNLRNLLHYLCTTMSNYDLVVRTINNREISYHFLNFVAIWLRLRKRHCGTEGLWNPRSLFKSPFDETLDLIRNHANVADKSGLEDVYCKLNYALDQYEA